MVKSYFPTVWRRGLLVLLLIIITIIVVVLVAVVVICCTDLFAVCLVFSFHLFVHCLSACLCVDLLLSRQSNAFLIRTYNWPLVVLLS